MRPDYDPGVRLFTLPETAELLGLSESTVLRQIQRGSIRASRFGRAWAITEEEVERYRLEHLGKRSGGPRKRKRTPPDY
jgi:excisionase family DNA binding protein